MLATGTITTNRVCAACPSGTFNAATANVPACAPWQECGYDQSEWMPGTAWNDRGCGIGGWTRQFGTSGRDEAQSVGVGEHSVAVGGRTTGAFASYTSSGGTDCYVQRYGRGGELVWTHQFGTAEGDNVYSVTVSPDEAVVVAGRFGTGPTRYFVRQYDAGGGLEWSYGSGWEIEGVTAGGDGSVFVVGGTGGALPGQVSVGSGDAVLQKLSAAGSVLWTRQFGTPDGDLAVAVDEASDGRIIVVGVTYGAFEGHAYLGEADIFVRSYDAEGTLLWTRQFGTTAHDVPYGVSTDTEGGVVVVGTTSGALPGQSHSGSADAFVRKYGGDGALLWTRQFGGVGYDLASGVSMAPNGNALVAGSTRSTLLGQVGLGQADAFLSTYNPEGTVVRTRQFGTSDNDYGLAVSSATNGHAYMVGHLELALPGQVSLGGSDAFLRVMYDP